MTNYYRITSAMPRQLAQILANFDKEKVFDWYCKQCSIRDTDECNGKCPIPDSECILRWLNELKMEVDE